MARTRANGQGSIHFDKRNGKYRGTYVASKDERTGKYTRKGYLADKYKEADEK